MKSLTVSSARKQISVYYNISPKEESDVEVQQVNNLSCAFTGQSPWASMTSCKRNRG